jgi:hypothetical protein
MSLRLVDRDCDFHEHDSAHRIDVYVWMDYTLHPVPAILQPF